MRYLVPQRIALVGLLKRKRFSPDHHQITTNHMCTLVYKRAGINAEDYKGLT